MQAIGGLPLGGIVVAVASVAFYALIVLAMLIDAHERRVPNALVLGLLASGVTIMWLGHSPGQRAFAVACAVTVCGALVAAEVFWRRARGEAGIGMGDVKVLFCLMLVDPVAALVSFAAGLLLLALVAAVLGRRSLPLMPFFGGVFLLLAAVRI